MEIKKEKKAPETVVKENAPEEVAFEDLKRSPAQANGTRFRPWTSMTTTTTRSITDNVSKTHKTLGRSHSASPRFYALYPDAVVIHLRPGS